MPPVPSSSRQAIPHTSTPPATNWGAAPTTEPACSAPATRGWCVRADKVQLENAILNLAVNARDAMNGRGDLTIATGAAALPEGAVGELPAGDYVTVAVTDTGCGMSPDVAERVFEPFFTTKPIGQGTGLGLSQVFVFVQQSEGHVALQSAPGSGTSVTLYLPEMREGLAPADAPSRVAEGGWGGQVAGALT